MKRHGMAEQSDEELEDLLEFPVVANLRADLKGAASILTPGEARFLVDLYYQIQDFRKYARNVVRAQHKEPNTFMAGVGDTMYRIERLIAAAMDVHSDRFAVSRWAKGRYGVGPVLAGGLVAHIDPTKFATASRLWSFAGMNPEMKWEPGQKRPYNARLKNLLWKLADCQWKFHNRVECPECGKSWNYGTPDEAHPKLSLDCPKCHTSGERAIRLCRYGTLLEVRKAYEVSKNESGACADAARSSLATKKFRNADVRRVYESGRLPDGRVHLRAYRWLSKLFLGHYLWVGQKVAGMTPIKPFIIDSPKHPTHTHMIEPDGWTEFARKEGIEP